MTIREHDLVVLAADIRAENLKQGDVGTVVLLHRAGAVRPVGDKEIAHVRRVA